MRNPLCSLLLCFVLIQSCKTNEPVPARLSATEVLHQQQDELTQVIIYDVFTPPVASRIYAYTSLAAYEAIRHSQQGAPSLASKLKGFPAMPEPEKNQSYDFTLAASHAFFTVAHKVVFSIDSLKHFEDRIASQFHAMLPADVYDRSAAFGDSIGKLILKRAVVDNYLKSRGKPKYLGSNEEGKWRPTPPDYLDGVEYCWREMQSFAIDSAAQFRPAAPPPFSMDTTSQYYAQLKEVYAMRMALTDEQKYIAKYWDDNPFVIEHSGHLAFGKKKITPGGHWMGIAAIASKKSKADPVKTQQAYALTAMALYDGFISCWDAKYTWSYIRPVTVINEHMDKMWTSFLQTPPFPDYTSGHSTISGAASAVLTGLFGDHFAFHDDSDKPYIGMERDFSSFAAAADEASVSRLYGGIHYRMSLDTGLVRGRMLGNYILTKTGVR